MTRVTFDANALGFKVGDVEEIDDGLAKTLCAAEAAHVTEKPKKAKTPKE